MCVWFQVISPLSLEQALSARDSLAKAIYGRAFTWLVQKLNQSLAFKVCFFFLSMRTMLLLYLSVFFCQNVIWHEWSFVCFLGFDVPSSGVILKIIIFSVFLQDEVYYSSKCSSIIGLLDIYGFEVFQHNRLIWRALSLFDWRNSKIERLFAPLTHHILEKIT